MRQQIATILIAVLAALPLCVSAGVTVHYQGHALDSISVDRALVVIRREAERNGWPVSNASAESVSLTRVINEKDVPYRGSVRGLLVRPDPMCEPLIVQFDSQWFMQDYVKTQFAGTQVHTKVVRMLKLLKPFMRDFNVVDEGEYWETEDQSKLGDHISKINSLIAEMKRSKPTMRGPVTLPNGRIVDLLEGK